MVMFWKAAAIVVVTVILGTAVGKKEKDIAIVLIVVACCGIAGLAMRSLSDVIAFLWRLSDFSENQSPFAGTMLKIAGVAVITEMTSLIPFNLNETLTRRHGIIQTESEVFVCL